MSGIFSLFRELLVIFKPEKAKDAHLFWRCVFITFIISSFWLWASEHKQTLELQGKLENLTVPHLNGEFNTNLNDRNGGVVALLDGVIWNTGATTSIVQWRVSLVFRDGRVIYGDIPIGPNRRDGFLTYKSLDGKSVDFSGSNYWPSNDALISQGGKLAGWMIAFFPNISKQEIVSNEAKISLDYLDVNGKPWTASAILSTGNEYVPKTMQDLGGEPATKPQEKPR